jgi:predicted transcriptional regulator
MAKPIPPSMAELEARIMNRLQEQKRGQTIEQLQAYLNEPQSRILSVLLPLISAGFVTRSNSGVWTMVREDQN